MSTVRRLLTAHWETQAAEPVHVDLVPKNNIGSPVSRAPSTLGVCSRADRHRPSHQIVELMDKGKKRKAPEPDSPEGEGHEPSQGHRSVRTDHGASPSGSSLTAGRGADEQWKQSIFSRYPPTAGGRLWKSKQPGETIVAPLTHGEDEVHGQLGLLNDQLRAPRLAHASVDENGRVRYRDEVDKSFSTVIKVYRVKKGATVLVLIGESPAKGHVNDSPYEQCGLKIANVLIENGIDASVATMDATHPCYVAEFDKYRNRKKASMVSVSQMVKVIGGDDQKQQSRALLLETSKAIATAAALRFHEELRPSHVIAMPIGALIRPDGFFNCAPMHLIAQMKEYGSVDEDDTDYATLLATQPYPGQFRPEAVGLIVNAGVAAVAPSLVAEATRAADELTRDLIARRHARASSLGGSANTAAQFEARSANGTARCDGSESHLEVASLGGSANTAAQFEARVARCDGSESHREMSSLGGSANTTAQFEARSAAGSMRFDGGVAHIAASVAGGEATRGSAHGSAKAAEKLGKLTRKVLERFDTTAAAVESLGLPTAAGGNVSRALNRGSSAHGFKWRFVPVVDGNNSDDRSDSSRAAGPPPSAAPVCYRCKGWGDCGCCFEATYPDDDDDDDGDVIDISEDQ